MVGIMLSNYLDVPSRPFLPPTLFIFEENETKEINEDAIWRNIVSIFLQNHHRDDRGKLGYCLFFKMVFFSVVVSIFI